jgi:hypothetical protein
MRTLCYDKDQLFQPLGPWFPRISTQRKWTSYYIPKKDLLHKLNDEGKHIGHSRVRFGVFDTAPFVDTDEATFTIPVPIDAFPIADGWRTARYQQVEWPDLEVSEAASFQEYIQMLPEFEASLLLKYSFLLGNATATFAMITDMGSIIIVLDGSAVDDHGVYGWVLGKLDGTHLAHGYGTSMDTHPTFIKPRDTAQRLELFSSGTYFNTAKYLF